MVLGVCHVFFGHFYELQPSAFPFFCCLQPVFGSFLAFRRPLFDFFPLTHACGISFGEKSQKAAFFRPKKTQKRASGNRKRKCFRHQFKKMPKKNTQLTPKTIFLSIFIYFLTNVRDIYHFCILMVFSVTAPVSFLIGWNSFVILIFIS